MEKGERKRTHYISYSFVVNLTSKGRTEGEENRKNTNLQKSSQSSTHLKEGRRKWKSGKDTTINSHAANLTYKCRESEGIKEGERNSILKKGDGGRDLNKCSFPLCHFEFYL